MITLSNFIKNADNFTLLLTMGEKDTVDMLPTVDRPFSPDFYAVSVDYGVPAAGSVAINYFTQENFVFVNGEWSKDSVPSILDQLEVDENGVYIPAVGVDGYDKVTVDVPQLDTSDATAVASDILSPKTAYVKGEKVTGTIGLEAGNATPTTSKQTISPSAGKYFNSFVVEAAPLVASAEITAGTVDFTTYPTEGKIGFKQVVVKPTPATPRTVTPTKEAQNVTPDTGEFLSEVTVNAIPDQYIIPTGEKDIVANGTADVSAFATVNVNVPQLDTSDATASASDILSPKTAYVNGQKVTGTIELEEGSATPTKAEQTIAPTAGKYFDSFVVNPIPSQYIIPSGTKTITANGTTDVTAVASVSVNVATTDVYKHDVYIKLNQANPGDLSTTDFKNYSTCEIRYVKCNTYASAYTTDQLQTFFDFLPADYDLASVKLVEADTGNTLYFSQFKLDDYQGGEFSLSNWGGAGEALIKDKLESFTVTDTVTKIS